MDDLVTKRYARKLTEDETAARSPRTWYLPHHSVFHPHDGISLNSLLGVLLRFRQEHIVHCTCGRHTLYVPSGESTCQGHHALSFLWWEDTDFPKSPEEHHMVSCIFGAKDSLICTNYCIKRTAEDNKIFSEEAVKSAQEDFYIDDLLKATETLSGVISLTHELMALLEKGGFCLIKWTSNS